MTWYHDKGLLKVMYQVHMTWIYFWPLSFHFSLYLNINDGMTLHPCVGETSGPSYAYRDGVCPSSYGREIARLRGRSLGRMRGHSGTALCTCRGSRAGQESLWSRLAAGDTETCFIALTQQVLIRRGSSWFQSFIIEK